jgi:hypothetical protein
MQGLRVSRRGALHRWTSPWPCAGLYRVGPERRPAPGRPLYARVQIRPLATDQRANYVKVAGLDGQSPGFPRRGAQALSRLAHAECGIGVSLVRSSRERRSKEHIVARMWGVPKTDRHMLSEIEKRGDAEPSSRREIERYVDLARYRRQQVVGEMVGNGIGALWLGMAKGIAWLCRRLRTTPVQQAIPPAKSMEIVQHERERQIWRSPTMWL